MAASSSGVFVAFACALCDRYPLMPCRATLNRHISIRFQGHMEHILYPPNTPPSWPNICGCNTPFHFADSHMFILFYFTQTLYTALFFMEWICLLFAEKGCQFIFSIAPSCDSRSFLLLYHLKNLL